MGRDRESTCPGAAIDDEAIIRRLVDAAVQKALGPWQRKQEAERAIKAGMNRLPWNVQYGSAYVSLKQRALETAVVAVGKVRAEASYREMETAAVQAVQPMVLEYEHQDACKRMLAWIYISGTTDDEAEAAKEAVRKALAAVPVGATQRELERAKERALAPFEASVARRREAARIAEAEQAQRQAVSWKADFQLDHIARYLEQEYEFDGGWFEMRREAERLRPLVREALIDELVENPELSGEDIREAIEDLINDGI